MLIASAVDAKPIIEMNNTAIPNSLRIGLVLPQSDFSSFVSNDDAESIRESKWNYLAFYGGDSQM